MGISAMINLSCLFYASENPSLLKTTIHQVTNASGESFNLI